MSIISEEDLKGYEEYSNFTKYENEKAKFNTKISSDMKHNGEIVEVLGLLKGRDIYNDRYIVRFNDDTIDNNIMNVELEFDYIKDPIQEDIRRILSKIIKAYDLSDKEIEGLQIATLNYDYEANEGTVFTEVESIERLFTEDDGEKRLKPTIKQLKAMAEFIRETEKYYMLYGYEEYTVKVIDSILNKKELLNNEPFKYFEISEVKNILKNKEKLVFVDDGINELIIKYKDIPDFIVDVNRRIGMRDLKFYDYYNPSMTPIITTFGEFLDKCNPKVRKDIIERLVKLQLGEENCKEYKVMDEDTIINAKEEMKQERKEKNKNKER